MTANYSKAWKAAQSAIDSIRMNGISQSDLAGDFAAHARAAAEEMRERCAQEVVENSKYGSSPEQVAAAIRALKVEP